MQDGSQWGLSFSYAVQPRPEGIAQAFLIAKNFIDDDAVCLILGDNIFYGHGLTAKLSIAAQRSKGATVFGYWVKDPQRYGVMQFDGKDRVLDIQEKPEAPPSNWVVTGLYYYDRQVVDIASQLKPSARGELEITDINMSYLKSRQLYVEKLGRGIAWLDTGTHESMMRASSYIEVIEERQGLKIACVEEIAYRLGYITDEEVQTLATPMLKNSYGRYLLSLIESGTD
jgi:glucose-1-phosphate thymidylyltransferase